MEQWFYLLRNNIETLDPESQEMIYHSFRQFVYKDIYFIVRDHSTTEDIIHEAFIKVVVQCPKAKHSSNLQGWIKQVTRNTALDWLRKNKKNRQNLELDIVNIVEQKEYFGQNAIGVASEVENKLRDELLHQTINELKPDYRILLLLYYVEEKTYSEICRELQLSEQVVTQRLARARKKLLQYFSRKWVDRHER
ncbi:sigma-70 family RNA polymerase sigma factor [Paenibacillus oenotherae]|uniref:Sigma-70 family RNA polymerase sigma factor n=1 Tax=Paenibacillus oenotherae TaxID=1435645 RepID=A0ABS7DBI0_9BACL|nr:sigma-70 family RNA polymerase sigma factor [Paenibacillus oenotherae]MBW7477251.1 sigma-70 family RNA polymerase sigma factor [Paenibacillus oenotherae]